MPTATSSVIAMDVGASRVGLAIASLESRLPRPLITLTADETFIEELKKIIASDSVSQLVIGLPRSLDGEETAQTAEVRAFANKLGQLNLPISFQDEAVTSKQAEAELQARGKDYSRGDIDALAAVYILDDWLQQKGVS